MLDSTTNKKYQSTGSLQVQKWRKKMKIKLLLLITTAFQSVPALILSGKLKPRNASHYPHIKLQPHAWQHKKGKL